MSSLGPRSLAFLSRPVPRVHALPRPRALATAAAPPNSILSGIAKLRKALDSRILGQHPLKDALVLACVAATRTHATLFRLDRLPPTRHAHVC